MSSQSTAETGRVRKHLYLVVDHPDEEYIGCVRAVNKRYVHPTKNEEAPVDRRNIETNETYTERLVGLGYYDFDSEDDYEERFAEVAQQKLREVDENHLRKVGIDPDEDLAQ